jgi:poly-gamma-glutamate synthesis protein (capsule biosynthesis protein)
VTVLTNEPTDTCEWTGEGFPLSDRLIAIGDVILGDTPTRVGFGFHSKYPRDASSAFALVAPLLRRGEIVIGNLECLLTTAGRGSTRLRRDQMRGDPEYAVTLRSTGVTAVAIANNHAMQHGREAFADTVRHLQSAGIDCVGLCGTDGWCSAPVVQTTRTGLRVGLLGYSWRPRQYDTMRPPYAEGDIGKVILDVMRLRRACDSVAVSLHWGEEFLDSPSAGEVAAAHRIIEVGASVIVGHHPHVVRPVERYHGGLICYSLGNFVTDTLWTPEQRIGLVAECRLGSGPVSDIRLSRTRVDDSYRPVPVGACLPTEDGRVATLTESGYLTAVGGAVRRHRLAAYKNALFNIHRFPPTVLADLIVSTIRNRIGTAYGRLVGSGPNAAPKEQRRHDLDEKSGAMSILHVVAPARFGGLESVVRALAAGQVRRGHSVRVAVMLSVDEKSPHPFVASLEAEGVATVPIRLASRNYLGERRAMRALCREQRPDVVHTHGFRCDVIDGAVAREEGIAVVSTCHGFIQSDLRGQIYQWLQRRTLRGFDAVVAVSTPVERELRGAGLAPAIIHRIPNAFAPGAERLSRDDSRRLLGLTEGPVIGWVGRLSIEKGVDVALETFARLEHSDARLVIMGDGRDAAMLRSRASALGVGDRVEWRGEVADAARFFRAFDVFLLSSRTEGTPIALLEAMAANVPIVATRVGGVPDMLDESSANLVDSGEVAELASALADVFADPDRARIRALRARSRLEEGFAVEPWLSRYESIYRSVYPPTRESSSWPTAVEKSQPDFYDSPTDGARETRIAAQPLRRFVLR